MERKMNQKDWTIVSEIDIIYSPNVKPSQRPKVNCSKDLYMLLLKQWNHGKLQLLEEFKVIFINRGNRVLGLLNLSIGGLTETVADLRLIFGTALKSGATAIVLAHNHPSGNLAPSRADQEITKQIKSAGEILRIKVLDHLIISGDEYFSFTDNGLI